jgi:hypothetical protein
MTMNASEKIEMYIKQQDGWKSELLATLREMIHEAEPMIAEEWKWDVPVYVHSGMVCATSAFKDHVKINFFKGAKLTDSQKLINAGLESKSHRAINFKEGDKIPSTLKELIKEAVSLNKTK